VNGELPKGWVWTSLGEVTENPQYGWTTRAITEGELHLLRTTDITSGKIDWNSVPFCEEEPENIGKYLLEDGDIVISRAGSVGYSYLLKNPEKSIFASYLIRFKPLINRFFLYYFLKSPSYWEAISEKSIGIAMANVNASKLKQIEIPLPPLAEQQRIVNKIEELFTNLDKGIESISSSKLKIHEFKKIILNKAFSGDLTKNWRKFQKNDSGIDLLKKIIQERKYLMSNKEIKNNFSQYYTPKKGLIDIPDTWAWASLSEIGLITTGKTPDKKIREYWGGNVPFIMPNSLNKSEDYYEIKYIKNTDFYVTKKGYDSVQHLEEPSVLVCCIGTLGRVGICNIKAAFSQQINAITPHPDIDLEYLAYYCHNIEELLRELWPGITYVPIVNKTLFSTVPIPLPPIQEQKEVINSIKNMLTQQKYLENQIIKLESQSKLLRQSILKKAFEGKLVPQDPNDEPAGILLEKIKKQRLNKEELFQEKLI